MRWTKIENTLKNWSGQETLFCWNGGKPSKGQKIRHRNGLRESMLRSNYEHNTQPLPSYISPKEPCPILACRTKRFSITVPSRCSRLMLLLPRGTDDPRNKMKVFQYSPEYRSRGTTTRALWLTKSKRWLKKEMDTQPK